MPPAASEEAGFQQISEPRFSLSPSAYRPFAPRGNLGRRALEAEATVSRESNLSKRASSSPSLALPSGALWGARPSRPPKRDWPSSMPASRVEREGFLRAAVVAKEELCASLIEENQQLSRLLEEGKTRHRLAVEKVKE